MLPSYNNIIGKKHGKLYIQALCRKKNRNLLKCICECGRIQYLYRYELKNKFSCTKCNLKKEFTHIIPNAFFEEIKKYAEENQIKFNLTYDYLNELFENQKYRCALSKNPIGFDNDLKNINKATIVLIDPNKGYIKNNIEFVNKVVAKMKNNLTNHDFVKICNKITRYYKKRK